MSTDAARRANGLFLERLEAQILSLREQTFPGRHPGPYTWLSILAGVIETAKTYILRSKDQSLSANIVNSLIVDAGDLGQFVLERLQHFRGAEASELPYQTVRPLQRWMDELGIQNDLFFRAEHLPNYELAGCGKRSQKGSSHDSMLR